MDYTDITYIYICIYIHIVLCVPTRMLLYLGCTQPCLALVAQPNTGANQTLANTIVLKSRLSAQSFLTADCQRWFAQRHILRGGFNHAARVVASVCGCFSKSVTFHIRQMMRDFSLTEGTSEGF